MTYSEPVFLWAVLDNFCQSHKKKQKKQAGISES